MPPEGRRNRRLRASRSVTVDAYPSFVLACAGLAVINGALVALPAPVALRRLERLRSPAWALVFPGILIAGTLGVLALPNMATGLVLLAGLATPPLAGIAMVAVVHGRHRALLVVPFVLVLAATLTGWPGQLAASLVTALGCLTLGASLVQLTPAPWLTLGVLGMCAVDVLLLVAGIGQPADALLSKAGGALPAFHYARLGPICEDYPDLVLAAVVGGILARRAVQRRAAVLVATLAGAYAALLTIADPLPATVPLTLALLLLELGPRLALHVGAPPWRTSTSDRSVSVAVSSAAICSSDIASM